MIANNISPYSYFRKNTAGNFNLL